VIPNYQQFMRPFLEIAEAANGNEVKLRDVINQLADKFGLSDEERNETLPSGVTLHPQLVHFWVDFALNIEPINKYLRIYSSYH
jgi:restriction endonuclease Mrr